MIKAEIELLAPAGKWDVMVAAVAAGADAVYLGGKRFNMRMLRPEYNFSDSELRDACEYLHQRSKKLYITVNNLYYQAELEELQDYLVFINDIGADAVIIQDLAIAQLHKELNLQIPIHASVQMGIANGAAAALLEEWGFSRAILSKNLSLQEIKDIHHSTRLSIEYFAHGDLCVSHAGQCYMSSFMAGESGNRGRCLKPCRWPYSVANGIPAGEMKYYLAHNDLCLVNHIQDLIEAGVASFKIEGRMRGAEYIAHLITCYREALDNAINKQGEGALAAHSRLEENKIRDFCTGNLYGRPEIDAIGLSGAREPVFISTALRLERLKTDDFEHRPITLEKSGQLSVKLHDPRVIPELLSPELETVIMEWEGIRQLKGQKSFGRIQEAARQLEGLNTGLVVELPRIVAQNDLPDIRIALENIRGINVLAVMVNDYGSLKLARDYGYNIWGGYGLNLSNTAAAGFLLNNGLKRLTISPELDAGRIKDILNCQSPVELEMMVHGPLCGMITDLCLARVLSEEDQESCGSKCLNDHYKLQDEFAQNYKIFTDEKCRNYIFYPYDLCLLPYLNELLQNGINHFRLECQYYPAEKLIEVFKIYRQALRDAQNPTGGQADNFNRLLRLSPEGLAAVPWIHKSKAGI